MSHHPIQETFETIGKNYHRLLDRAMASLAEWRHTTGPALHKAIDVVSNELAEAEELTLEEARHLADSLKRDLVDAARHLKENRDDLKSWLDFDLAIIEESLLEAFLAAADKTTVELTQLEAQAKLAGYRSGEIVGFASLQCDHCQETLHFKQATRIPVCPRCGESRFHRKPSRMPRQNTR